MSSTQNDMLHNPEHDTYSARAERHLWMAFSRMGSYGPDNPIPMIVRGQGAYVWDSNGKRYLDGISSLFTSQLGHGRTELAEAAAKQMSELAYFPVWTYLHPKAVELAERLAHLAPGELNRVFFTTGGAEAVETSWKLARQYFKLTGHPEKTKVISRDIAYHGTAMGALAITGLPGMKTMYEPLVPGAIKVPNTNFYRAREHGDDFEAFGKWAADEVEAAILREGPETIAMIIMEPVQNAGGCYTGPPNYWRRIRELCDEHNILLVADEVITGFGRLGEYFASTKYGIEPDIICCAKGLTSAYAPIGAMIAHDRLMEPFLENDNSFMHGYTFAGHPVSAAVAMANLDIFEREGIFAHVKEKAPDFQAALARLHELPIVGDIRGDGFFYGIELVKDKVTKETFNDEESERLLRGYLSGALFESGLICRADDRGDPVIMLAPPLICEQEEIDIMANTIYSVLEAGLEKI